MTPEQRWERAQRHELRWWKRYLGRRDRDAYHEWKKHYWGGILRRLPEGVLPGPGSTVLDIGCGPAGVFMVLEQYRVIALDPLLHPYVQDDMLRTERYPWVNFVTAELERLDDERIIGVPRQEIAGVFCMNVLNHVRDLTESLRALHSIVSDGHLVLTIDVHRARLFRWLMRAAPVDTLHPHHYSRGEYVRMLEEVGFRVILAQPVWKRGFLGHWLMVARGQS